MVLEQTCIFVFSINNIGKIADTGVVFIHSFCETTNRILIFDKIFDKPNPFVIMAIERKKYFDIDKILFRNMCVTKYKYT